MSCTKEEIEKKRLAALQKRQIRLIKDPDGTTLSRDSNVGPIKNQNISHVSFHPYAKNVKNDSNISSSSNIVAGKFNNAQNNINFLNKKMIQQNNEHNKSDSSKEWNHLFQPKQNLSQVVTAKAYLISEHRFEVALSEFCIPLINIFKSMSSGHYDAKTKLWNFSLDDYKEFLLKAAPLEPHVVVNPIPEFVLKILKYEICDADTVDLLPIEETLRNKLMPFQQDGVRFGIARRGRCMIADEMGLGKTFQGLAIASYYRRDWPLLIVTTSSMRETWQSKIHELLPSVPMSNIAILANSKDGLLVADKQTEVVITSFKISSTHKELLQKKKFGVVIIDESHNLKSYKAQCTTTTMGIASRSPRVVLLSGTPALSRPSELYTQLALIENTVFNSYNSYIQFGIRYCDGKQSNFGWDMSGESNLSELQVILRRRFLIRRTKDEVLTDLGGITRETVQLDQAALDYAGLQPADAYDGAAAADRHAALLGYFSRSAAVKVPAVCKYIKQLLKEYTGKFLVFAHHRAMIDALCETMADTRTEFICIVGSTPAGTRAELVDTFQHSASVRAAVLSITAAGAGITLTAAGLVVFAELHWNPGVLMQAEARAHRVGRAGGVLARYLLAAATADDVMWPMLQGKLQFPECCPSELDSTRDLFIEVKLIELDCLSQVYVVVNNVECSVPNIDWSSVYASTIGSQRVTENVLHHNLNKELAKGVCALKVLNGAGLSGENFEDTTMMHQESKNTITQYLSPKPNKNKNDYIPGTNILKSSQKLKNHESNDSQNNTHAKKRDEASSLSPSASDSIVFDEVDEFIMNYDEDDDLLAGLNIDL